MHLEKNQAGEVRAIIQKYLEVLVSSFKDFRPSELNSNNQILQKERRMSPIHNKFVRHEIDPMLASGIITPVESSWISPLAISMKKDGSL